MCENESAVSFFEYKLARIDANLAPKTGHGEHQEQSGSSTV
jgi:hypothetical protein